MTQPEPFTIDVEFPLTYRPSQLAHGLNFDLVDAEGHFIAAVNDEAAAKLLTNFTNKFMSLVEETQKAGAR